MSLKRSFFSRIAGNDDYFEDFSTQSAGESFESGTREHGGHVQTSSPTARQSEELGELAVDVYQTPDAIVVKALIAGVQPNTIDISLTREMVTISGSRHDERESEDDNYFQRELYWGSFSRSIILPEEVDVDLAEASEKHGVLIVRLPKINKKRQTKLKVRAR